MSQGIDLDHDLQTSFNERLDPARSSTEMNFKAGKCALDVCDPSHVPARAHCSKRASDVRSFQASGYLLTISPSHR